MRLQTSDCGGGDQSIDRDRIDLLHEPIACDNDTVSETQRIELIRRCVKAFTGHFYYKTKLPVSRRRGLRVLPRYVALECLSTCGAASTHRTYREVI